MDTVIDSKKKDWLPSWAKEENRNVLLLSCIISGLLPKSEKVIATSMAELMQSNAIRNYGINEKEVTDLIRMNEACLFTMTNNGEKIDTIIISYFHKYYPQQNESN